MQTSEASKVSSIKSARLWSNCSTSLAAVAERAIRLMSSIWRMRRRSLEYSRAFSTATAAWPATSASSHQKDGAIGGSEIIAHDQQDLVQHRIHVHAGEDHLSGFLQHGHFTDAGMDVFQWGISHGAASAVANTNSVIACL